MTVARYLLTPLILSPLIAAHYMLPDLVLSMRESYPIAARVFVYTTLAQIVPYFLAGFVAFGFLRYIFHLLKLDNADAIGKEFEKQENYLVHEDVVQSIELGATV